MKTQNEEENKDLDEPHVGWEKTARVVSGFKDGDGEVPTNNWLLNLKKGTIFLVMNKVNSDLLCEYKLAHKFPNAVRLQYDDHRGIGEIWVEPELFVKKNDFVMTLVEGEDSD